MVATQNFEWEQGEDLILDITYQIDGSAVDLSSDYSVRMDIAPVGGGPAIFIFNSEDIPETETPAVPDGDNEVTLGSGGKIHIVVPRSLTLPNGAVGNLMSGTSKVTEYQYDIFLRKISSNTQKKLLKGTIKVNGSVTKWA